MPTATVLSVRVPVEVRDLIGRAAQMQGKSLAAVMLDASVTAAQQVLLDQTYFPVTEARWEALSHVMNQPLSSNLALRRLLMKLSPWER